MSEERLLKLLLQYANDHSEAAGKLFNFLTMFIHEHFASLTMVGSSADVAGLLAFPLTNLEVYGCYFLPNLLARKVPFAKRPFDTYITHQRSAATRL